MTILLYKNGQWLIDGEQPLEGVSLDNLAAILTNPKDGDVMKYDETSGMWVAGSSLPPVSSSDNGKVLAVENGGWAAADNLFVVTASGTPKTLDKTASEISAAVSSGKDVVLVDGTNKYIYCGEDNSTIYFLMQSNGKNVHYAYLTKSDDSFASASYPKLMLAFSSDNGSELIVKNGSWTKQKKKFLVTLTPTALDYSGTMDKTVAEINAAYEAGQEIVFRVIMSATAHMDVDCTARWFGGSTYPSFNGFILAGDNNVFIFAFTSATNDGTKQTYGTTVYSLTPAS